MFNCKKRAFTLVEILIAAAVLAIFVVGLFKFMSSMFNTQSDALWMSDRNAETRIAERMLKMDISKATYPSEIKVGESGVNLRSFNDPDKDPSRINCIRYIGDEKALNINPGEKMTITCISAPAPDGSKPWGLTNTSLGLKKDPRFKDEDYDSNEYAFPTDKDYTIMEWYICSPINKLTNSQGEVTHCKLKIKPNPRYKGERWDLWYYQGYQKTGYTPNPPKLKEIKIISDVIRIDICHILKPNDPPLGDYTRDDGTINYVTVNGIQTSSTSNKNLTEAEAMKDLRRTALLAMAIYCRKTSDPKVGKPIVKMILEADTNVFVIDKHP